MLIKKVSLLSGKVNQMDLPITQEQIDMWEGMNWTIQKAFPQLDADQREFLLSGATPEEWLDAFPDDE